MFCVVVHMFCVVLRAHYNRKHVHILPPSSIARTETAPATVNCTSTAATTSSVGTSNGHEVRTTNTRARCTPAGAPAGLAVRDSTSDSSVAKVPLVGVAVSQGPGASVVYSISTRKGVCVGGKERCCWLVVHVFVHACVCFSCIAMHATRYTMHATPNARNKTQCKQQNTVHAAIQPTTHRDTEGVIAA